MVNVASSLSTKGPPILTVRHWTLVSLYWALAGMVRVSTVVPSGVVISEITRSLRISGTRISRWVPLTLHRMIPPLVSHAKTADWFRKTVVLSGAMRISGENIIAINNRFADNKGPSNQPWAIADTVSNSAPTKPDWESIFRIGLTGCGISRNMFTHAQYASLRAIDHEKLQTDSTDRRVYTVILAAHACRGTV